LETSRPNNWLPAFILRRIPHDGLREFITIKVEPASIPSETGLFSSICSDNSLVEKLSLIGQVCR
jgi:hypothetical protein